MITVNWEPQYQRFAFYVTKEEKGQTVKALPVSYEGMKGRFEVIEPCLIIESKAELQELMDNLWSAGLRPSARADEYKAQLGSMRDHLNDMRALVFKTRDNLK